MAIIISL